jgi:hypothetical protein
LGAVNDSLFFTRVANIFGEPLDGLVYAVGSINFRSLQCLTGADAKISFRVKAMGAALTVQTALPALKKSTGIAFVVLFSSVAPSGL